MHELLSPSEMARVDASTGVPSAQLIENAGRAIARAIRARIRPCRTLVLAGPGNNGADGRAAARQLAQTGWPVRVVSECAPEEAARADLVIDAIVGAGLNRELPVKYSEILRAARRVVAIDVPSGLDGATGQTRGTVRQAELTITFFRLKPGHLLLPGRLLCGELVLADIGIPASILPVIGPQTFRNEPALWRLPKPTAESHKYTRGDLTILGGARMTGAAQLAAAAARRAGAGILTIAPLGSTEIYQTGASGLLVNPAPIEALLRDPRRTTWLAGPGLGLDAARAEIPKLLKMRPILDADALTAFAGHPEALRGAAVLTPHAGEFSRLFGSSDPDRLAAVRAAAARTGAVVLLKGADTIIAAPDGRATINDNAPHWLATAGTGDVLAGLIAGLIAQGMPPWEAACAGAWLHGAAATTIGPGLIAEDLPDAITQAIRKTNDPGKRREGVLF